MSIKNNIDIIEKNIKQAAEKSGRKREDILLVGVSKLVDIQRIEELMELGVKDLGENWVQELNDKYKIIGDKANWHLIGHLQTNKVKYIADKVKMIHSVDSVKLASEIDKRAKQCSRIIDILIEVNMSGEKSKNGIKPECTENVIREIARFNNIKVKGLMTVAPFVENVEENREIFSKMNKLAVDIRTKNIDNIDMVYLSMGMTNDYVVAIEEGANIVRIGTAIFGKRNYAV